VRGRTIYSIGRFAFRIRPARRPARSEAIEERGEGDDLHGFEDLQIAKPWRAEG